MTTESLPPEAGGTEPRSNGLMTTSNETAAAPVPAAVVAAAAGITADASRGVGVKFVGVERHYKDNIALAGLDLEIQPGEMVALLGPSGCGKTTALRLLGGFDFPTHGALLVDGRDVTHIPANKRDMGMVFQAYSLFPNMTVKQNVAFGLRMRGKHKTERFKRADELLEIVGLDGRGDRYPYQLSGGQQQRVAIARALAIEPQVLLLDEPLSALDALVRHQLRAEIRSLQLRLGITTLFVTHDQSEALSIADRVGVMRAGKLEQIDSPEMIYRNPATSFVAEFVGAMNRLPGRVGDSNDIDVLGKRLRMQNPDGRTPGELEDALIRPESLTATPDSAGSGLVEQTTFLGSTTRLQVRIESGQLITVEMTGTGGDMAIGTRVSVRVLTDSVRVSTPGD
jgi:putative spermidine/putrescine transport system ATP-binding protein